MAVAAAVPRAARRVVLATGPVEAALALLGAAAEGWAALALEAHPVAVAARPAVHVAQAALGQGAADPGAAALGPGAAAEEEGQGPCDMGREGLGVAAALDLAAVAAAAGPAGSQRPG